MVDTRQILSCEQQSIHLLGKVQSYGGLLLLNAQTWRVEAAANTNAWLMADGTPLDAYFDDLFQPVRGALASETLQVGEHSSPVWLRLTAVQTDTVLDVAAYRLGEYIYVEFEPAQPWDKDGWCHFEQNLQSATTLLHDSRTTDELCRVATAAVQRLTGFDRCMVYRFDADWHGSVVAETRAKDDNITSYLGHHFPASDIPAPARAIFEENWLRIITDVDAEEHSLMGVPAAHAQPFDLSKTLLRSPAKIHLEYLRNMDVGASMTLSLLRNGRLWGLVTCHHRTHKHVVPQVRSACEQIARLVSALIVCKEQQEEQDIRQSVNQTVHTISTYMRELPDFAQALCKQDVNLLHVMASQKTSAAVRLRGRWSFLGRVPSLEQLNDLLDWLTARDLHQEIFQTTHLQTLYPPAAAYADRASGVLAVPLPNSAENYLLWFRPEQVETRIWAGSPIKPISVADDFVRIHPRKSFAAWQETIRGTSAPWLRAEIDAARLLRKSFVEARLAQQLDSEIQLRKAIEAEKSRFELVARASEHLAHSLNLNDCLLHFSRLVTERFCDACVIYLVDGTKGWREPVVQHRSAAAQEHLLALEQEAGPHQHATHELPAGQYDRSVLCERLDIDSLAQIEPEAKYTQLLQDPLAIASMMLVPMSSRGRRVGVIKWMRSARSERFCESDLVVATELSRRAAHAVENVGLYQDAHQAIDARERLLHVVSHDLKNPVNVMQLSAEMIERKVAKAQGAGLDVVQRPLERIRSSCQRMLSLIDDLLSSAKLEGGQMALEPEQVPAQTLLNDVQVFFEPLAQAKDISVQVSNPFADSSLVCDRRRMMQVFSNLVGNAIKFTPVGGTVTVEVAKVHQGSVVFAVRDTGPGIAAADAPHIFERYWQAKDTARQGTGLGLSIAKGIVQAHKGQLSLEQPNEGGACFLIEMPRYAAESARD